MQALQPPNCLQHSGDRQRGLSCESTSSLDAGKAGVHALENYEREQQAATILVRGLLPSSNIRRPSRLPRNYHIPKRKITYSPSHSRSYVWAGVATSFSAAFVSFLCDPQNTLATQKEKEITCTSCIRPQQVSTVVNTRVHT